VVGTSVPYSGQNVRRPDKKSKSGGDAGCFFRADVPANHNADEHSGHPRDPWPSHEPSLNRSDVHVEKLSRKGRRFEKTQPMKGGAKLLRRHRKLQALASEATGIGLCFPCASPQGKRLFRVGVVIYITRSNKSTIWSMVR
jgi:hypothetical protein